MTINPYILLGIGSLFAALYAGVITFGWALTRRNRRIIHREAGCSLLPVMQMPSMQIAEGTTATTVSLTNNTFVGADGKRLDVSEYDVCVASGQSPQHANIAQGDLLFLDKSTHAILYVFTVPDLKDYR